MNCINCGNTLNTQDKFCPICGTVQNTTSSSTPELYCRNCGTEIFKDEMYCPKCGATQGTTPNSQKNFCKNCGLEIFNNENFCPGCGASANSAAAQRKDSGKSENSTALIITIIVLLLVFAITFIAIYMINSGKSNKITETSMTSVNLTESDSGQAIGMDNGTPEKATPQPATEAPIPERDPVPERRGDRYSPSLTYKRMPDIHNSQLVNDVIFEEVANVIISFDHACENYMNRVTNTPPSQLKVGTKAYTQQVDYKAKHPNLTQYYDYIDVINVRHANGYYYAWVDEAMTVTEKGTTKSTLDHWIYKLEKFSGVWYITDYASDPLFK